MTSDGATQHYFLNIDNIMNAIQDAVQRVPEIAPPHTILHGCSNIPIYKTANHSLFTFRDGKYLKEI